MKRFTLLFIAIACIACAAVKPTYVSTVTLQPREFVDSVCNAHNTHLPEIDVWHAQATDSTCLVARVDTTFKHARYITTSAPYIKSNGKVDNKRWYLIVASVYPYRDSVRVIMRIEPQPNE